MDSQPRILIVDDSAVIRKALTKQMEASGARITHAEDGEQAWLAANRDDFDLIITDVEMPNLDGFGLCQRLKNHTNTRGIPVIILSSLEADKDVEQGFNAGAAAYVAKSEAHLHLNETIEKVFKQSRFSRSRCILVVDDSSSIRKFVSKALEEAGFQVMTAENGKSALSRIEEIRPDLIISDINMPEMDGIELCKKTHADPDLADVPFVVMSTNSDRAVMRRLLSWGASSYLVKPFNPEQIVITILGNIPSMKPLLPVILHHHERFDGKGYPDGLKGEKNVLWARIAAVADTYHALTSDRPYRRGVSHEKALEIIEDVRGSQLCPVCVDAFMKISADEIKAFIF